MESEWDVIVVGAGLAGLAAGATATRAGARTLVLEAHRPGGRARVTEREGYTFNLGGHALYRAGAGSDVLTRLGVEVQGAPPPLNRYRALAGGRLHALPSGPATLLRTSLLGTRDKAAVAALLARLPRLKPERFAGQSVEAWLADRGLRPGALSAVRALLRISTYTPEFADFGADAAIAQLQAAASAGVLYLDGGWRQLVDGLAGKCQVRPGAKVAGVEPAAGQVEVMTAEGALRAGAVVLAVGGPGATAALLPADPGWGDLGPEVTAACLDAGVRRVPDPGYVLGVDAPLYTTLQSPPARQAPPGHAVVASIRYGATTAAQDRADLEAHMAVAGIRQDDIVTSRFLARMVVAGAAPLASRGGLPGRPGVASTGLPGVFIAGDWVGPVGLIGDAALSSGHQAALRAVRHPVPQVA